MRQRKAEGYEVCSNCFVYPWRGEPIFIDGTGSVWCSDCEGRAFDGDGPGKQVAAMGVGQSTETVLDDEDRERLGSDVGSVS